MYRYAVNQTHCRVGRIARCTRECRIPRDVDNSLYCTSLRVTTPNTEMTSTNASQNLPHRYHGHVCGARNRLSLLRSDVSCRTRLGGVSATTTNIDEVFYVVCDSTACTLTDDGPSDKRQTTHRVDGHTYVCTTGTNLYRILALSDKLSTMQNAVADDVGTGHQDCLSDSEVIKSCTEGITVSRNNGDSYVESVSCVDDDIFTPRLVSDVCQHVDKDELDSDEIVHDSMTASQQRQPPSTSPPSTSPSSLMPQLRRHCSLDDDGGARQRQPRSLAASYRAYLSHVLRGTPNVFYSNDSGTPTTPVKCRQASEANLSPVDQTTSTWASRHPAACTSTSEPPSSHDLTQSMRSTLTVVGDDFHDKSSQLASASCIGTDDGDQNVHRPLQSFNVLRVAECSIRHQRPTQSPDHVTDRQQQSCSNSSSGRAAGLMMKWLKQSADDQSATTTDDVISGHVTVSDDRSTASATKCDGKKSFTQNNTRDAFSSMSVNNPGTIPRCGITSGDVVAGEVENKLCTTDHAAEQWPGTFTLTGETESSVMASLSLAMMCLSCSYTTFIQT